MADPGIPVIGELRAWALLYAEAGLQIFPVNPTNKTPLVSQYEATVDAAQIGEWWNRWPNALIGHRLPPEHVILDVDPRHNGAATWAALRDAVGGWPTTRVHRSGRGDGGGHVWWLRPDDNLSTVALDAWAKKHGTGHQITDTNRWVSGIDLLQHNHRYTILPPSPHPETAEPYQWADGRGLEIAPAPMPALLADLLTEKPAPVPNRPAAPRDPNSIADWYSTNHTWRALLEPRGWTLRAGDGEGDGSRWRHPAATSAFSATVKHGCLFVYSPNTPFPVTEPGRPAGQTRFAAYATLEHGGDLTAAAKTAREAKDGPRRERIDLDALVAPRTATEAPSPAEPAAESAPERRLRRWDMAELLAADRTQRWALRGLLLDPTYGMIGGEKKTLKSYVGTFIDVAIASGQPLFDHFTVDRTGPVVAYVGEGGRIPYTHRLERVCAAMGVDPAGIPLHPIFEVAPIGSDLFAATLRADLDDLHPILVHLDPLYAYHGTRTDSRNLHEEGALLTQLSGPTTDAGANLLVANHFNKTGTGVSLDRITQAGGGEWSDTWILLSHRNAPNVETGQFRLTLEIGSRQWGGTTWELDLDVGRFDVDRAEFDGAISWDLRRAAPSTDLAVQIAEIVAAEPDLTKEELAERVGGRRQAGRQAVRDAEEKGLIVPAREARKRSDGRSLTVWVYRPPTAAGSDRSEDRW